MQLFSRHYEPYPTHYLLIGPGDDKNVEITIIEVLGGCVVKSHLLLMKRFHCLGSNPSRNPSMRKSLVRFAIEGRGFSIGTMVKDYFPIPETVCFSICNKVKL